MVRILRAYFMLPRPCSSDCVRNSCATCPILPQAVNTRQLHACEVARVVADEAKAAHAASALAALCVDAAVRGRMRQVPGVFDTLATCLIHPAVPAALPHTLSMAANFAADAENAHVLARRPDILRRLCRLLADSSKDVRSWCAQRSGDVHDACAESGVDEKCGARACASNRDHGS